MRFLRMRPAVWAMISCSFSSLTRNVAFGSNSVTTPGNSRSSSLAIRCPALCATERPARAPPNLARNLAESCAHNNYRLARGPHARTSFAGDRGAREPGPDARHELVAHGAVAVEALLAIALDASRIGGRPILDRGGKPVGEFERLVMSLGRERNDQVVVQTFPVLELLEG